MSEAELDRLVQPPPELDSVDLLLGAALLDDIHKFLGRFIAYPDQHSHIAHTLWNVHAHLMDAWESTPRIAFLSPEPASGKTRALEITELLVPRPIHSMNVSPAALFREIDSEEGRPTILFDEIDTVFGPKAKPNEEIRGLLNAGHRKGLYACRCVVIGKIIKTEKIPAYCALAVAGLGGLPDTLLSRCVVVRMRRRAPVETVEPYRRRLHSPEGDRLCQQIAVWAASVERRAAVAWPEMPDGISDRDADIWEPLLAVADMAGGDWPSRSRVAAVALVALSKESTPSLGVRLLDDIRTIFGDEEQLPTRELLDRLHALVEAPWGDLKGKPLNDRGLAQRLHRFGVKATTIRDGDSTPRGYRRGDFLDAWARYLPPLGLPPMGSATAATGDGPEPPLESATSTIVEADAQG